MEPLYRLWGKFHKIIEKFYTDLFSSTRPENNKEQTASVKILNVASDDIPEIRIVNVPKKIVPHQKL